MVVRQIKNNIQAVYVVSLGALYLHNMKYCLGLICKMFTYLIQLSLNVNQSTHWSITHDRLCFLSTSCSKHMINGLNLRFCQNGFKNQIRIASNNHPACKWLNCYLFDFQLGHFSLACTNVQVPHTQYSPLGNPKYPKYPKSQFFLCVFLWVQGEYLEHMQI